MEISIINILRRVIRHLLCTIRLFGRKFMALKFIFNYCILIGFRMMNVPQLLLEMSYQHHPLLPVEWLLQYQVKLLVLLGLMLLME